MLNYAESKKSAPVEVVPQWCQNAEVDMPLLNSMMADNTVAGPDSVLNNSKYNPLLTPFDLEWCFGFDVNVPVLNLTDENRREIFYTSTNAMRESCGLVPIKPGFRMLCMTKFYKQTLQQTKISCATVDRTGQWLATADNGPDKLIMIWNTHNRAIVWTIFNHVPKRNDLLLIGLSPNARLLITISNINENTVNFWLWTYGRDIPDDTYSDERNLGAAKSIEFHPNKEDHFMIVFEKGILFFVWDHKNKKLGKVIPGKSPLTHAIGSYTDATYVNQCHECFVSTTKGCILVFGNTIYAKNYVEEELDNDKFYVKCIQINRGPLNCITSADEIIVTGDSNGIIMFLDKRLKLLYWFSRSITKSIKSISFKLNPRMFKFVQQSDNDDDDNHLGEEIPDCYVDRSEEYERLILEKIPRDASPERRHFVSRDFCLTTVDGTIYLMNFVDQQFIPLFSTADSCVAAIDTHGEMPYIVIAYAKGRLMIYNYETHQEVISSSLPEPEEDAVVTTIKYSGQSLHLACGRSNGELWLLQPAMLAQIYVEPFKFSSDKIEEIAFSQNSLQMAYYDSNMTVFAFCYDPETEDWIFKGKVRPHYKEITHIMFLNEDPSGLYSIGKDRHLIRYTDIASEEEIDILTRDRIEQKDQPIYFTSYPKRKFSKGGYFLVADDKNKYKVISSKTTMCTSVFLGPAYGCFRDSPVVKMEFLPKSEQKYLIFMTKKQIGIQLMPMDGNPFKYIGSLGHPDEILDFRMSFDGKYIFTIGKNDRSVFKWKIKTTSVETVHLLGGQELQPFYCLLEGGRGGFLYQEMRDLFYYMQILQQGEQICAPRIVSNCINLGELPDLMRACGYYPSEYEIENLLTEMRYKDFDDTGVLKDKVTFCEFVKLFINHKPAYGYTIEGLEECFDNVTAFYDEYNQPSDMTRDDFIESITTTGEQVSTEQIYRCLTTLLHADVSDDQDAGERDFSFMPDMIEFDYLAEDLLGIDMSSIERAMEEEESEDADDGGYYYYH